MGLGVSKSKVVKALNKEVQSLSGILNKAVVPSNVVQKGVSSFSSSGFYGIAKGLELNPTRYKPVKSQQDLLYVTKPTFLSKRDGPSQLISTIPVEALSYIPGTLTKEENLKVQTAYKLLSHILNACAIILGSEVPSSGDINESEKLKVALQYLYKKDGQQLGGNRPNISIPPSISTGASGIIANVEDILMGLRSENAFLSFKDTSSVIGEVSQYIMSSSPLHPAESSSSKPDSSVPVSNLSIFIAVLQHVNTLTICGTHKNSLLSRLSKSGSGNYPDILLLILANMSTLLETVLPTKSTTLRTMVNWASTQLRNGYMSTEEIKTGNLLRQLFLKQGDGLKAATEKACKTITSKFGNISIPARTEGVVVHTYDKSSKEQTRGIPITGEDKNKAASALYADIQTINREMVDTASSTFKSLFEVSEKTVPGSINIPIKMTTPLEKVVYITVKESILNSKDPLGILAEACSVLVYKVATSYVSLVSILDRSNMREVYGL